REMARLVTGRWAGPLRVPTRLMLGDKDPVCRMALVDGYEKFADDMQVEVLENCGHFLPEEAPAEVSQRALAFFG
ncbi:MAG: hypothetical protein QOJ07_3292, partial [Thermoleophilaceae bacterium]|nr:hypothetical protein [Thermoleophilaceae bacterium]